MSARSPVHCSLSGLYRVCVETPRFYRRRRRRRLYRRVRVFASPDGRTGVLRKSKNPSVTKLVPGFEFCVTTELVGSGGREIERKPVCVRVCMCVMGLCGDNNFHGNICNSDDDNNNNNSRNMPALQRLCNARTND